MRLAMQHAEIALLLPLACTPAAHAQRWRVNSAINHQIIDTAIRNSALRRHERLPDVCAKSPRYGGKVATGSAAPAMAARFIPVASDCRYARTSG